MKKKILSVIMAVMMLVAMCAVTTACGNSDVADMQSSIAAMQDEINSLKGEVTDLKSENAGLKQDISDLSGIDDGSLSAMQDKITALEGKVAALELENGELQKDIAALETENGGLSTSISSLQGRISTLETARTALQGEVDGLKTDIMALSGVDGGDLTGIQNKIIALEEQITTLEGEIANAYMRTDSFFDWDNPIVIDTDAKIEAYILLYQNNRELFIDTYYNKVVQVTGIAEISGGTPSTGSNFRYIYIYNSTKTGSISVMVFRESSQMEFDGKTITIKGVFVDWTNVGIYNGRVVEVHEN